MLLSLIDKFIKLEMEGQVRCIALWDTIYCVVCCIFWQILLVIFSAHRKSCALYAFCIQLLSKIIGRMPFQLINLWSDVKNYTVEYQDRRNRPEWQGKEGWFPSGSVLSDWISSGVIRALESVLLWLRCATGQHGSTLKPADTEPGRYHHANTRLQHRRRAANPSMKLAVTQIMPAYLHISLSVFSDLCVCVCLGGSVLVASWILSAVFSGGLLGVCKQCGCL